MDILKNFSILPTENHKLLAGGIREAEEEYKNHQQETEWLFIHFYKRMSNKENVPIIRQLKSIGNKL